MKTINTKDLTGPALDWAVAKCEFPSHVLRSVSGSEARGNRTEYTKPRFGWVKSRYTPCTLDEAEHLLEIETSSYYCPSVSGGIGQPIIERERMLVGPEFKNGDWYGDWRAVIFGFADQGERAEATGPTALIAAMRCYVASKLGDSVEVPEELL